jgi:hypothetical protein
LRWKCCIKNLKKIPDVILGDVSGNGGVDIGDAVTIVNFLVGKTATLSRGTGVTENMKEPQ